MSVRILTGDARLLLATLPDASVQCCVTSPPYANLRDYGHPDQIGAEATAEEYISELVSVFRRVRRVLRDDGTLWVNLGDGMADKQLRMIPARVALALQADGWWLRSAITWCKPAAMPESVTDRPTCATEMVFLLTKASRYFYDAAAVAEPAEMKPQNRFTERADHPKGDAGRQGHTKPPNWTGSESATRNLRNWWVINSEPFPGSHFAVMPSALASICIRAGTSERGQCPHCASPWARVVERESRPNWQGGDGQKHDGTHYRPNPGGGVGNDRRAAREIGWQSTCSCPEHKPVPQTVLDPFSGAGTTLLVADRLGRNGIGIELNPEYATMSRERLRGDCPMFAEVA